MNAISARRPVAFRSALPDDGVGQRRGFAVPIGSAGGSDQARWSSTHKYGRLPRVKTTLELRDDLLRRAKALALARGMTLKELFTEALEERVGRAASQGGAAWRDLSGNLRSLRAETAKLQARVDAEFEQADEDDLR